MSNTLSIFEVYACVDIKVYFICVKSTQTNSLRVSSKHLAIS